MSRRSPIGLFYGSSTCYTEFVGEKIAECFGEDLVDLHDVAQTPLSDAHHYNKLIFGIPTWDYGELQEDWEAHWADLDALNLSNRQVALYGVGDQIGYPEWFLDALGYLHDKAVQCGADIVGHWPVAGYEFSASQALTDDKQYFVGLAIDEENQFELTDERIETWVTEVRRAFQLL